ncbi:MAG: VWA domain-containing protein, partial [bacterium]|nr:VWA domain-containing protein [bacterium]
MANWREQKGKGAKKKEEPLKAPKPISSTIHQPGNSTGDWRTRGKRSERATKRQASQVRSWRDNRTQSDLPTKASFSRWGLRLSLLALVICMVAWAIYWAATQVPRLNVFVFVGDNYQSPELDQNPFSNNARDSIPQVNPENIVSILPSDRGSPTDGRLQQLEGDQWIKDFELGDATGLLKGGGPSRKTVAFYINAYARFENQNLLIYSAQASPFSTQPGSSQASGISLEAVLKSIADSIPDACLAWVIFDLRLPPAIETQEQLNPPWRSVTQTALNNLGAISEKLLITLPCDDGQQNWLAPEFKSSFFGHYLQALLSGQFSSVGSFDLNLRLDEFQRELLARVRSSVMNRRYAVQTPVWLSGRDLRELTNHKLIKVERRSEAQATNQFSKPSTSGADPLWRTLTESDLSQAFRWDPLGYARVEAPLLAWEDANLYRPDAAENLLSRAKQALAQIEKPRVSFQVSLIEDELRARYFETFDPSVPLNELAQLTRDILASLKDVDRVQPEFWRNGEEPKAQAEEGVEVAQLEPSAEMLLPKQARPFLIWNLYATAVRQRDAQLLQFLFDPARIRAALEYAGQDQPEWLEMLFLHRLAQDMDWNELRTFDDRVAYVCAEAVHLFHRIQELSAHPEPALALWRQSNLPDLEGNFLAGMDRLLAGRWREADQMFKSVESVVKQLESQGKQLAEMVSETQQCMHDLPYLLAWAQAEYQFADNEGGASRQRLEAICRELGSCADLSQQVYLQLEDIGSPTAELFAQAEQLHELWQGITGEIQQLTLDYASNPPGPKAFRRNRIALKLPSPLISIETRKQLRDQSYQWLTEEILDTDVTNDELNRVERSSEKLVELFLSGIPENSQSQKWSALAERDLRAELGLLSGADNNSLVLDSTYTDARNHLLRIEFWQRLFAPHYGSFASLHDLLVRSAGGAETWVWKSASLRWDLDAAFGQQLQTQRLANASWGNGPIDQSADGRNFWFVKQAKKYALGKSASAAPPAWFNLRDGFEKAMQEALQDQAESLSSLTLQAEDRRNVTLIGPQTTGMANVYIDAPQGRFWSSEQSSWMVDLNASQRQSSFEPQPWTSTPELLLSFRGNQIVQTLRGTSPPAAQPPRRLAWERPEYKGARLTVEATQNRPTLRILLLVDCSESMEFVVNKNPQTTVMDIIKEAATVILDELEKIHQSEAKVEVGVIAFGLKQTPPSIATSLSELEPRIYRTRDVRTLDEDWHAGLQRMVSSFGPSGDTPLYNAIVYANEILGRDRSSENFVFVLTDGVNLISKDVARVEKNYQDVKRSITQSRTNVSIFHFDHFDAWLAAEIQEAKARNSPLSNALIQKTREQYIDGIKEIKNIIDEPQYVRSENTANVVDAIKKSIPRTVYRVIVGGDPPEEHFLNEPVNISQNLLPANVRLETLAANGNSASTELTLEGGEEITLAYDAIFRRFQFPLASSAGLVVGEPRGSGLSCNPLLKVEYDTLLPWNPPPEYRDQLGFRFTLYCQPEVTD